MLTVLQNQIALPYKFLNLTARPLSETSVAFRNLKLADGFRLSPGALTSLQDGISAHSEAMKNTRKLAMPRWEPISLAASSTGTSAEKLAIPKIPAPFMSRNVFKSFTIGKKPNRRPGRPKETGYQEYDQYFVKKVLDMIANDPSLTPHKAVTLFSDPLKHSATVCWVLRPLVGSSKGAAIARIYRLVCAALKKYP